MELQKLFESFSKLRVLIIGDVMIDSYIWGRADRISPEAPVPVINVTQREERLGGAANVARNVRALQGETVICSVIGNDPEGETLLRLLKEESISSEGVLVSEERKTTIKHRILAGSQHLLRIDSEMSTPVSAELSGKIVEQVAGLLSTVDVIIFEDYDKGILTEENITAIVALAKEAGVPTVVDPKKRNFLAYKHTTLFKPNLKELREGLKIEVNPADDNSLEKALGQLRKTLQADNVLVTLSEYGVSAEGEKGFFRLPAHKREISDVSGAGDTVVSILGLCMAAGCPVNTAAALANLGGGLVCEHLGVVPIDRKRLIAEALEKIAP